MPRRQSRLGRRIRHLGQQLVFRERFSKIRGIRTVEIDVNSYIILGFDELSSPTYVSCLLVRHWQHQNTPQGPVSFTRFYTDSTHRQRSIPNTSCVLTQRRESLNCVQGRIGSETGGCLRLSYTWLDFLQYFNDKSSLLGLPFVYKHKFSNQGTTSLLGRGKDCIERYNVN